MLRIVQVAGVWLVALLVMANHAARADVVIAAHRAVYDLSLKRATDRSGVSSVSGRMVIELTGNRCEGWAVNFRMVNQYLLQRGTTRLSDNRSSSWESGDGLKMHYTQRQFVDSRLETEARVKVGRDNLGEPGKGEMTKPNKEVFEIAPGVVFPVQHQIRLVEAALAGESRERSVVYDGSEGAKSYVAVSFIGKEDAEADQKGQGAEALRKQKAWPVSISYFATENEQAGESTPAYQVSFRMFENGVAGDLVLDYGDFALDGKLTRYEAVEQPPCE